MKKYSPLVASLLGAFFIFIFTLPVPAQVSPLQNRSTVTGYVFDQQRRPVTQVPVELINDVNSVIQRTRTDGSGRFIFRGLSSGRFAIRVLPLGTNLEEQSQEIEIAGIGALGRPVSDHVQRDFYLRVRRDSSSADAVNEVVFVQEIPEEARKAFEKAMTDLESKNAEAGIEGLQKALGLFPNYFLALEKLSLIYLNQEKYQNALEVLTKIVAVNPRSFNGWYGLSYANYALERSGPAVESGKKAVSLNADSVNALLILGVSQRQAKQFEDAEKSLIRAKKIDKGKTPDIHWNLALLYAHNLKRYKEAAGELELYLKIYPQAPNAENVKKLIQQFRDKAASPTN